MSNPLPLPWPYVPGGQEPGGFEDRVQQNLDALAIAIGGVSKLHIAVGQSPAFTWSGGLSTQITVPHGLGVTPQVVVPSSGRYGDASTGDARAPWLTTVGTVDATNFVLLFSTKNNATIGAFSVPAGACYWIAVG